MWLRFDSTLYINKRVAKKLYKLYTNPTFWPTSRWFSVSCEMYSLRRKLYTNYTLNPTLRRFKPYTASVQNPTLRASKTLHWGVQNPTLRVFAKLYTRRNTNPTFCFWTRISRMEQMEQMGRIVRNVCNEHDERNERKTGNGNRRWHASSLLQVTKKNPTILSEFSAIRH